jgi:hypothetical protein
MLKGSLRLRRLTVSFSNSSISFSGSSANVRPRLLHESDRTPDATPERVDGEVYTINILPEAALIWIFSYISKQELIHSLQFVCMRWRFLIANPSNILFPELDSRFLKSRLQGAKIPNRIVHIAELPRYRHIVSIILVDCKYTKSFWKDLKQFTPQLQAIKFVRGVKHLQKGTLKRISQHFPDLQELSLRDSRSIKSGAYLAGALSQLRALDLSGLALTSESIQRMINPVEIAKGLHLLDPLGFTPLTQLNRIFLSRNPGISTSALQNLFSHLRHLTHLQADFCQISDDVIQVVGTTAPNLHWLSLRAVPLTDRGLAALAPVRLTFLSLRACTSITSAGIVPLLGPQLQHLNLSQCQNISNDLIVPLFQTCPHLQHLNLRETAVRSSPLLKVQAQGIILRQLNYLNLRGTRISSRILQYLSIYPALKTLVLSATPALSEAEEWEWFNHAFQQLIRLDARACRLPRQAYKELRANRPELIIRRVLTPSTALPSPPQPASSSS